VKPPRRLRWPLVLVVWLDSCAPSSDWHGVVDWNGLGSLECVSVGYLIAEDATSRTIAPHLAYVDEPKDTKACGIMVIPRGATVSLKVLERASRGDGRGPRSA